MVKINENETQIKPNDQTYRKYLIYLAGQILSLLGSEIVEFSIIYWITIETQSVTLLSIAFFLVFIPKILFSPLAGVWADKLPKKPLIGGSDSLQAISTLFMILYLSMGGKRIAFMLGMNVVRSLFQTFHGPASTSIIPLMVPKEKLTQMNGIRQLSSNVMLTVSPIIASLLLGIFNIEWVLLIDILTCSIAVIILFTLPIPDMKHKSIDGNFKDSNVNEPEFDDQTKQTSQSVHLEHPIKSRKSGFFHEFRATIQILKNLRGIGNVMMLAVLANLLLTSVSTLFSYFILTEHEGNLAILGLFSGSIQAGMIAGAFIVSIKKRWKNKTRIFIAGLTLTFIAIGVIGGSPKGCFGMMIGAGFIGMIGVPILNAMLATIVQGSVPPDKIGRVSSILNWSVSILMPIGYLISGPIADLITARTEIFFIGIIGLIGGWIVYLFSGLYKLNDEEFGCPKQMLNPIIPSS